MHVWDAGLQVSQVWQHVPPQQIGPPPVVWVTQQSSSARQPPSPDLAGICRGNRFAPDSTAHRACTPAPRQFALPPLAGADLLRRRVAFARPVLAASAVAALESIWLERMGDWPFAQMSSVQGLPSSGHAVPSGLKGCVHWPFTHTSLAHGLPADGHDVPSSRFCRRHSCATQTCFRQGLASSTQGTASSPLAQLQTPVSRQAFVWHSRSS